MNTRLEAIRNLSVHHKKLRSEALRLFEGHADLKRTVEQWKEGMISDVEALCMILGAIDAPFEERVEAACWPAVSLFRREVEEVRLEDQEIELA